MSSLSALLRAQLAAAERMETSQARITELEAQMAALQQQLTTARAAHAEHQGEYAQAKQALADAEALPASAPADQEEEDEGDEEVFRDDPPQTEDFKPMLFKAVKYLFRKSDGHCYLRKEDGTQGAWAGIFTVVNGKPNLDTSVPAPQSSVKIVTPRGRSWGVSDCHSHFPHGDWAREATETGSYAVCVTPTAESETANFTLELVTGVDAVVSRGRYRSAKKICIGDTLFMGDNRRGQVFKGVVKGQEIKGFFSAADASFNSFRRRVEERTTRRGHRMVNCSPLSAEIEMSWQVEWKVHDTLTDAWKKHLNFSDQSRSVRPLSGPPPTA
jgi:hypothetical protein